jgi:Kdo2-lipid IVA lauroyltransferase/acyltransferase
MPADLRLGGAWTRRQRLKNNLVFAAASAALFVASRLPRRALALLGASLGVLAWLVLPRERARVRERLAAGLGVSASPARVRAVFLRAGAILADTIALLDPRERAGARLALDEESRAVFRDALSTGRGVVFVSAHLGPWERLAALLVEEGFPVATVARESYDPRFTALYERLRAPRGVRSIYRGGAGAAVAIVRELAKGRAVGFLVDLPARVPSVPATLFGEPSDVPIGAARVALARRCEVLVGTCAPGGLVRISRVEIGDLDRDEPSERVLVRRITEELDARIAVDPEAWVGLLAPRRRGRAVAPPPDRRVSL